MSNPLVYQTGMPPNYTAKSREIIYDVFRNNPRFILDPFGPVQLWAARPEHRWN